MDVGAATAACCTSLKALPFKVAIYKTVYRLAVEKGVVSSRSAPACCLSGLVYDHETVPRTAATHRFPEERSGRPNP